MASGMITRDIITRDYAHTFPAFAKGAAGSRVSYATWDIAINGYKPIAISVMSIIAGVNFTLHVSFSDEYARCTQNRASGNAESNDCYAVVRVVYQRI